MTSFEKRKHVPGTVLSFAAVASAAALLVPGTGAAASRAGAHPARPSALAGLSASTRRYVEGIASMTPVQLIEAFGTDVGTAGALASLTAQERLHVEAIITMTPAQLVAAFGTGTP